MRRFITLSVLPAVLSLGLLTACGEDEAAPAATATATATGKTPAPNAGGGDADAGGGNAGAEAEAEQEAAPGYAAGIQASDAAEADWAAYCAETAAAKGGPGKKDCGGHLTVTVDTVEKCIADGKLIAQADCDLTMGQLAACSAVQAEDLCDAKAAFESKECVVVYKDCLFKGM
jgi:predicted amidohydrolase YtcJ